jgi:hypothetical protein
MGVSTIAPSGLGLLDRIHNFQERYGVSRAIYKSLDVVLRKVFHTSVHTVVWLDVKSVADMKATDPRFTFRFLTPEEIEEYAKDPTFFISPKLADGVRNGTEVCFAALAGDRLAAFGCYTLGFVTPDRAAGAAISFPSDVAYMSFGFTHPDFRGARLHALVMGLALQQLAERGVTKFVSLVSWTNWASLHSCWRIGYKDVGNMVTIGSSKRAIGFYPKVAQELGVRFGRKARRNAN